MKRSFKRKKGPVHAKKVTHDGIKFASGLEKYMYIALKKPKITLFISIVKFLSIFLPDNLKALPILVIYGRSA